jgi:hypothetical protein
MAVCVCEMYDRKGACGKCTRPEWLDVIERRTEQDLDGESK